MTFCFSKKPGLVSRLRQAASLAAAALAIQIVLAVIRPGAAEDAFPMASPVKDPVVGRIEVEILAPPGNDADRWEKIARNLIFLEEGHPFSDVRFSQSVSALNRSRLFASIEIPDPDWSDIPITMVFRLRPFSRIKDISIAGGFPLLEREILNQMTIYTGDAYIPEKIDEQAGYLEEFFRTEGYIDPKVSLTAERDPKDAHYSVHVEIEKGPYYEITRVRTRGNEYFSGMRLLFRLNTWQSSMMIGGATRLIEKKFDQDENTIRQFYWKRGFCEAAVETRIKRTEDRKNARITFHIEEGPRYDVEITGNDAFRGRKIKRELVIYEDGNINDFGLRRSIRNIETLYREAGYQDVRVYTEEETHQENGYPERKIELIIREGLRYIVDRISVRGNENVSTDTVMEQMITAGPGFLHAGEYVPETLNGDMAAIESFYKERGYLEASIDSRVSTRRGEDGKTMLVDVDVDIFEGPRTIISGIRIENLDVFDESEAMDFLVIDSGAPYREHRVRESRNALASAISEKGYPHVRVDTETSMTPDGTGAEVVFRVDQGPYVEMGTLFFTGNFHTREKTIKRQARIDSGEPFSLSEALQAQRNIRNINALEAARFQTIGLEEKAERVTLLGEINEKKPYFFQFAAGYDTVREFYFNTGGGTINLLGRNKELRSFLEMSMIGYKGEIGYTEPNLFNTRIVADASVFTEKIEERYKNFGIRSTGASVNFSRPLTSEISVRLGFLYDHRDQYRTDDTPIPPEDEDQYRSRTVVVTTPGITYNKVDSFVRPTRGVRASTSVGVSRGLDNDLDNFFKYRINTRYYYTPFNRLTMALMGQAGYIDPYGKQETIPEDQLFFLGGTMNVRGFSENRLRTDEDRDPVGGRTSLMGTVEARYDIGRNFEMALFYDTGTIRHTMRDAKDDDWRSSAGIGFRYHTPIGPIGLMHGWKLDRREGESPGAYHFTIGYTF